MSTTRPLATWLTILTAPIEELTAAEVDDAVAVISESLGTPLAAVLFELMLLRAFPSEQFGMVVRAHYVEWLKRAWATMGGEWPVAAEGYWDRAGLLDLPDARIDRVAATVEAAVTAACVRFRDDEAAVRAVLHLPPADELTDGEDTHLAAMDAEQRLIFQVQSSYYIVRTPAEALIEAIPGPLAQHAATLGTHAPAGPVLPRTVYRLRGPIKDNWHLPENGAALLLGHDEE